jgi:tripartite-type tricarboxylate transporter receptor subunit TctC
VSEANADGVGGLLLLRICEMALPTLARSKRRPPPLTPPRHALRARGEGNLPHLLRVSMFVLTVIVAIGSSAPVRAADWPTRPVTIITPYAAGGMADVVARLIGEHLSEKFGHPFIIVNRGGGAGSIGAAEAARAAADGSVFLFTSPSAILTMPMLQKLDYAPDSFVPVSDVADLPFVLAIRSSLPPRTLADFIAYAHAHPGTLNYASAGVGGISHLVSALFVRRAGIDAVHIPYKSAAPATAALLAGEVDMYFGGAPEMLARRDSDRITLLAASSAQRLATLPDKPAVAELYPGFAVSTWLGFVAPRGAPQPIIDAMAQATRDVLLRPDVVQRLASLGVVQVGSTPAEFAEVLRKDRAFYAEAMTSAGVRMIDAPPK